MEINGLNQLHRLNTLKSKNIKATQKFIHILADYVANNDCNPQEDGYCSVCDSNHMLHEAAETLVDLMSGNMTLEHQLMYNEDIRHNLRKSKILLKYKSI